jgi:PIN domain
MRLRYQGPVDHPLGVIRQLQTSLTNTWSGVGATASKDNVLNWIEDYCRPQLQNIFERTEEIFNQLEDSYNRLVLAPPMDVRRLNGLVQTEQKAWKDRLDHIDAELVKLRKLTERDGTPVVLDTSVLMEGKPFMTFDWHSLDPRLASEPVRLIVPILVVGELDDLLHDRNGDRKQRAREATRELIGLHRWKPTEPAQLPGKPDITIEVMLDDEWHQRRPDPDAEIIDQALQLHQLTGWTPLASCDLRQLYRAAAAELPVRLYPRRDEAAPSAS